jgi:hypothetical protein
LLVFRTERNILETGSVSVHGARDNLLSSVHLIEAVKLLYKLRFGSGKLLLALDSTVILFSGSLVIHIFSAQQKVE